MFRRSTLVLSFLSLWLAGSVQAEVLFRPVPPSEADAAGPPALAQKASRTSGILFVPRYFIDAATGDTTLFALRNTTDAPTEVGIEYFGLDVTQGPQRADIHLLPAKQTLSINIRDLSGLSPLPDGTLQGLVRIVETGGGEGRLAGDYFQVDLLENFATGDRLLGPEELCGRSEVRFLQGGGFDGGTNLVLMMNVSRGSDPGSDPPTALVSVYDEVGSLQATEALYSDQNVAVVPISALTNIPFGTLEVDFSNASGGAVFADYSASGKFSIGMNGTCVDP